jgi:protein involved in polysaccharide export with SLBB domain
MKKILSVLAVSLALGACAPMSVKNAVPLDQIPQVSDVEAKYYIQVEDVIRVTLDDVTGGIVTPTGAVSTQAEYELPVRPDGKILLPLLREPVPVAGYTTLEVQEYLKKKYNKYVKAPSVLVNIVEFSPRVIYVMGETGTGESDFESLGYSTRLTALRAVATRGYDVKRANLENIVVVRTQGANKPPLVMALNLKDAVKNVDYRQDIRLMPSDVVVIPKKPIVALNDWVEQYINNNVPLPGLTYGIGTAVVIDRVLNDD